MSELSKQELLKLVEKNKRLNEEVTKLKAENEALQEQLSKPIVLSRSFVEERFRESQTTPSPSMIDEVIKQMESDGYLNELLSYDIDEFIYKTWEEIVE